MRIGACGLACDTCALYANNICRGCSSGIDAEETIKWHKATMGFVCSTLECAYKKKQDYCLRCNDFPCKLHYEKGLYKEDWLNAMKEEFKKLQKRG